jgi:uncharacterized protein
MSIYDNTIPVLVHNMQALSNILTKAEAHCAARKIDPAVMLGMRLAPDMFNFTRQVQLVTDFAKGCGARLTGATPPSYADDESSFDGLRARLSKCVAYLEGLDRAQFTEAATRNVTVKAAGRELTMPGSVYVNSFVLPNVYFHMTTAYNILRHNGVELGKSDFVGRS